MAQRVSRRFGGEVKKGGKKCCGYSGKHRINGLKRNIVIDAQGNVLSVTCGKANRHDQSFARKTVDLITFGGRTRRPRRLGADKGYDSNLLRHDLKERHIIPCMIRRANNGTTVPAIELRESRYSQQRWKVERSFNWLNNNRRIDRFMERSTRTYQGFCHLAFIKFYLRKLGK